MKYIKEILVKERVEGCKQYPAPKSIIWIYDGSVEVHKDCMDKRSQLDWYCETKEIRKDHTIRYRCEVCNTLIEIVYKA